MPEHFEKWLRCNFAVADLGGLTIGHNYRNVHTSSEMLRGLRSRQLLLFYFSSRAHFTALAVNIAFQVQIHHQIAHESWCWKLLGMKIIRHRRKTKKKKNNERSTSGNHWIGKEKHAISFAESSRNYDAAALSAIECLSICFQHAYCDSVWPI